MPLTADQVSFIKNRCQLRTNDEPSFDYTHYGIDERPSRRGIALFLPSRQPGTHGFQEPVERRVGSRPVA